MRNNIPLFDVNASIGAGAKGYAEFRDARALLAHMDRLGIARALVWHLEARDLHPNTGNRRLAREIAAEPKAAGRLFPAFVVHPAAPFENGMMEELNAAFASGQARAIRLFPGASRCFLKEFERVLAAVQRHRPLVLWDLRDRHGENDLGDFGALAARFPEMTFAVTQVMWGGFGPALDLMWRHENIALDISWLHMRDAIRIVVERFGPDRLLFGIGPKAHHGAAIAALAHAMISDDARERIAHGNVERLLRLDPSEWKPAPIPRDKPLWGAIRSGKPIRGEGIIDAHGHLGPHTRGWVLPEPVITDELLATRDLMDRVGVERLFISSERALFAHPVEGAREIASVLRPHRKRFRAYLAFNPYYESELVPLLDEFFADPVFAGFKLLASYWGVPLTDPRYRPVWAYADKHALPILMHTWNGSMDTPALLRDIVPAHPNATFLLGHSGGGDVGRREAVELARANPNVMLEWCGSFTSLIPWEETLRQVGCDRVVFGSDTSAHDIAWELGRLLSLPLPDAALRPILSENMRRALARRKTWKV